MSDRRLRLAIAGLALGGAAIAAYLSFTRITDVALICPTSGCAAVQHSSYSELGGVPNAYLGLLAYVAIFITTLSRAQLLVRAGAVLALGAVGYAIYLLVVQLVVIDAVCTWCVASDAVVLTVAAACVARTLSRSHKKKAPVEISARRRPSPHA
jgi:uncharacterized membrane protein